MSSYLKYIERLSLTPVVEGVNPNAKESAAATDVKVLFHYLRIPSYQYIGNIYSRQLVYQYNVSFSEDFYLLNVNQLQAFNTWIINGGCLCIKYRVGSTVYRYKLLDHKSTNWSLFESYNFQIIKKNFCIEFWADNFAAGLFRGLLQPVILQTSKLFVPSSADTQPEIQEITNPPLLLADLDVPMPETLPYNQDNIAWLNNV